MAGDFVAGHFSLRAYPFFEKPSALKFIRPIIAWHLAGQDWF
jgi:hypothetical protein